MQYIIYSPTQVSYSACMKIQIGIFTFALLFTTHAFAYTLSDIAGKYEITSEAIPAANIMTITATGKVTLLEKSMEGSLTCKGNATLTNNVVNSTVKCENGLSFSQEIKIGEVKDLKQFTAPVFTSLIGQEIQMNFKKL